MQVIDTLLRTDKVSDKYKVQLRLAEKGMYPGLMCLIAEQSITMDMLGYMMEQVLSTGETTQGHKRKGSIHGA